MEFLIQASPTFN